MLDFGAECRNTKVRADAPSWQIAAAGRERSAAAPAPGAPDQATYWPVPAALWAGSGIAPPPAAAAAELPAPAASAPPIKKER